MQVWTTILEAAAVALVGIALVLAFVPSRYVAPGILVVLAVASVVTSYGLTHPRTAKAPT